MNSVFKFGGSLISKASDYLLVRDEINRYKPKVVVLSATKGMTNLLEEIFLHTYRNEGILARKKVSIFIEKHKKICMDLDILSALGPTLEKFKKELELLTLKKVESLSSPLIDEILSYGEFLSTLILSEILENYRWHDIRKSIKTNSNFTNAEVDFKSTNLNIKNDFSQNDFFVTQGFLGSNNEGNTTTLGREGSDYSASIIAGALEVAKVVIYTDVAGIYTSDPKEFPFATRIDNLTYQDAQRMACMGAKVLFPKTLNPIRVKEIPLIVKSLKYDGHTQVGSGEENISKATAFFLEKDNFEGETSWVLKILFSKGELKRPMKEEILEYLQKDLLPFHWDHDVLIIKLKHERSLDEIERIWRGLNLK